MQLLKCNSLFLLLSFSLKVKQILSTDDAPPTLAVIGCGPSGMFLLHAIATRKKQGIENLPRVVVYEKQGKKRNEGRLKIPENI